MQIRIADSGDQDIWDAYVLKHPEGLAYHLYAWKLAVEKAYGFHGIYLIAENSGCVCGVLPLIEFKIPFRPTTFVSLPYCDVAGPLADKPEISSGLLNFAADYAQRKDGSCHIRQISTTSETSGSGINKVRMILPLPDSSEALMNGFKAKLRSQVRKPERDGFWSKTGGFELLDDFYQVFSLNMRDLGSPVHSFKWIQTIMASFGEHAMMAVVYTPENVPVAAGIILCHIKTVSIPWASSLRDYNRLNPNMLLYWTFLSYAADHGYSYFDFGRSTPEEGTYRFKEQWGAKPVRLDWSDLPAKPSGNGGESSVRQIVESIWRKLPLGIANFLGPKVRRYVSL